tara:strand:- start:4818 stop:6593 length:1776 start_codon:yes stop_codon:yes gene_type:complete
MAEEFNTNQSSLEFGESLLASQAANRKKARKRRRQIDRVNQVMAGFSVADSFLLRKAQDKVQTFKQNLLAEKAQELHNLKLSDRWRTEVMKPLISSSPNLNLDDPNAFDDNGAVFNALVAKEIKLRKAAIGEYGALKLSSEDKEKINKAAEINLKSLKQQYNKYQGYLDTSEPLLTSKYDTLLERGSKDILSAKNTSSVRKLLGKFNIANKIEPDLVSSKYEGVFIPENDRYFEIEVQQRKEQFDNLKLSTDPKDQDMMEQINDHWNSRVEPTRLKDLSKDNLDTLYNTILDEDNNYQYGSFLDSYKNIDGQNIDQLKDGLSYTEIFEDMDNVSKTIFHNNVMSDLQALVASKKASLLEKGIDQDYRINAYDIGNVVKSNLKNIIIETTPTGNKLFGPAEENTYKVLPREYILELNETNLENRGNNNDENKTPSVMPFSTKIEIFRDAVKNEPLEVVRAQLETLQSEHPDQRSLIMDIYDTRKNQSKDTPSPTPTPTPVEPNTDLASMSASELEEYAERGGKRAFEKSSVFSDQIDRQSRKKLERYVETGGKLSYGLKDALERFGLPVDASVEDIEMFLDRNPLSSLLARN